LSDLKGLDFDIDLLGFDAHELDDLFNVKPEKEKRPPVQIIPNATLADLAPSEEERARLAGRKIMVEFSGGKDSSAAAIWAKHYFPEAVIELCYVDLGAEYYGFSFFLQEFADTLGCELKILRAPVNMFDAFLKAGKWPIFVGPYCHNYLHEPLDQHLTAHKPDEIVCIRGGRAQERAAQQGRVQTSRFMTIDRISEYMFFQPLYFTTKDAGAAIIKASGLPVWEGYSCGLGRTACRICPGQRPATYAAIRANFPQIWAELMEFERRFGPGAWQGSKEAGVRCTFTELADRGQKAFEENVSGSSSEPPAAKMHSRATEFS
jgi:3'-phosphoadenosine 5'-phosphosulfate sulfotransferase (PAPS reductase)/FAD synthetase